MASAEDHCDVIVTDKGEVYINGVRITRVTDIRVERDQNMPTELQLTMYPTSIIYGSPQRRLVDDMHNYPGGERVDMGEVVKREVRKRERSQAAREYIDPDLKANKP